MSDLTALIKPSSDFRFICIEILSCFQFGCKRPIRFLSMQADTAGAHPLQNPTPPAIYIPEKYRIGILEFHAFSLNERSIA